METFCDIGHTVPSPSTSSSSSDGSDLLDSQMIEAAVQPKRLRTPAEQKKRDQNNLKCRESRQRKKQKYADLERQNAELLKENERLRKRMCKRCGSLLATPAHVFLLTAEQ